MDESETSLRTLFADALEITDTAQRAAFLNRACGSDANLRSRVEKLLHAEGHAGRFLPDKPATTAARSALEELAEAAGPFDPLPEAAHAEKPGDRVARYELVEKIGEGGCGVVYLAQQETPVRRQVALKIIKLGMDTRQVIARFEAERQALAMMDHANIAKVFDAGSTDAGRPFFVMELVRGARITDYCDRHQLSTRARLELFIQVCQAVQHAHQKGIIHRDLKPSNILVAVNDGLTVPKVIDFGIAKATEGKLTDQTLFTAFEQFLGTPAYMSPEQVAMTSLDVDTRSDIYSLGVLLYELLTGHTPFDTKELLSLGVDELRRTIREKHPVRPSTRLRQTRLSASPSPTPASHSSLANDLDWIVMKCLEKDRARRYETASGLAADLRRHLNNEPVVARPPSRLYEFQKTVRRHKVGFAATASVIVALVAGIIGSTWQAVRATRAERQAAAETYTSDMNLALHAWEEGNLKRAQGLIQAHIPGAGENDLRGFEWRFLWNLCQDESLRTVKFPKDDPARKLATTPAHNFLAVACEKSVRLLEPSTGRELVCFSYSNSNSEAANAQPLVALASGATNLLVAHLGKGEVGLWDLASRTHSVAFKVFTNNVGVMALTPDGNFLAAADRDLALSYSTAFSVWDISPRPSPPRLVWSHALELKNVISAITFSPDGRMLVLAPDNVTAGIEIWETQTGVKLGSIQKPSSGNILALAFSPDGALLASAGIEPIIRVWNFAERTLKNAFEGHSSSVVTLAFSADGKKLVSGSRDATIRRWDMASQKPDGLWRLPYSDEVNVALAPDEKSIVSVMPEAVKFWSLEPRQEARQMQVDEGWGWLAVSPDSESLVVASPKHFGATLWGIASGKRQGSLAYEKLGAQTPVFSSDGRFLAIGGYEKEGLVGIWETPSFGMAVAPLKPLAYLTNHFESVSVCFSPDSKILAVAGLWVPADPKEPSGATNRLAFWEVGSWRKLNILPQAGVGETEFAAAGTVDFSRDRRLLAVGSRAGRVRLWDLKQERLLKEFETHDGVQLPAMVTFSPDGRWLASYDASGPSIVLFDLADLKHAHGVPLSLEESAGVYWGMFAPDSKTFITHNGDGLIKFWNLQTRKVALALQHGHGPAGFLAKAPNGKFLVSQDANGVVKFWDAPSLEEIDRGLKAN